MKIFDSFQFFDENMMLDLRLNILDKYVHKFIIVESSFMHSGEKKLKQIKKEKFYITLGDLDGDNPVRL